MMKPEVSIIVPVYNAQDYLRRCVDSILGQEYQKFELILVDDGSTDDSGLICREYASADPRVRVIEKENSGVSDARNLAIDHAEGTYLQFVDSDDWLTSDATKLMVRAAQVNQCDLVITDFYRVAGERVSHKGDIEEDGVLTREEFAACMMENPSDFYYGVLWNKLFCREIVEKFHLRMDREISWCEDFMFNLEYIRHAESFYALRAPIYYYVKRKGSLVTQGMNMTKTIKMKLMVFEYYNNFYKHIMDGEDYEKNRLQVYRFLVDAATDGVVLPAILPGSKKLGAERSSFCPQAVQEDGIIMEAYRSRKLMEYDMQPVALRNNLSLAETSLLMYLGQACMCVRDESAHESDRPCRVFSRRKLMDILGMPRTRLISSFQKLAARGLIKTEELREKKGVERQVRVWIQPEADAVLEDLAVAQEDYNQVRFADFSEEEIGLYLEMTGRIKANMQKILQ